MKFGDNDTLSAYVAAFVDVDYLFLFIDVDGLYIVNLNMNLDVMRIFVVENIDDLEVFIDDVGVSGLGTGGMAIKFFVARFVVASGCNIVVMYVNVLLDFLDIILY